MDNRETIIKKIESERDSVKDKLDTTSNWLTMSSSYQTGLLDAYNLVLTILKLNK